MLPGLNVIACGDTTCTVGYPVETVVRKTLTSVASPMWFCARQWNSQSLFSSATVKIAKLCSTQLPTLYSFTDQETNRVRLGEEYLEKPWLKLWPSTCNRWERIKVVHISVHTRTESTQAQFRAFRAKRASSCFMHHNIPIMVQLCYPGMMAVLLQVEVIFHRIFRYKKH